MYLLNLLYLRPPSPQVNMSGIIVVGAPHCCCCCHSLDINIIVVLVHPPCSPCVLCLLLQNGVVASTGTLLDLSPSAPRQCCSMQYCSCSQGGEGRGSERALGERVVCVCERYFCVITPALLFIQESKERFSQNAFFVSTYVTKCQAINRGWHRGRSENC